MGGVYMLQSHKIGRDLVLWHCNVHTRTPLLIYIQP